MDPKACETPKPGYMLFGKDVAVMNNANIIWIYESRWSDVLDGHFFIGVLSDVLSFTYYENTTDDELCAESVL